MNFSSLDYDYLNRHESSMYINSSIIAEKSYRKTIFFRGENKLVISYRILQITYHNKYIFIVVILTNKNALTTNLGYSITETHMVLMEMEKNIGLIFKKHV